MRKNGKRKKSKIKKMMNKSKENLNSYKNKVNKLCFKKKNKMNSCRMNFRNMRKLWSLRGNKKKIWES